MGLMELWSHIWEVSKFQSSFHFSLAKVEYLTLAFTCRFAGVPIVEGSAANECNGHALLSEVDWAGRFSLPNDKGREARPPKRWCQEHLVREAAP